MAGVPPAGAEFGGRRSVRAWKDVGLCREAREPHASMPGCRAGHGGMRQTSMCPSPVM